MKTQPQSPLDEIKIHLSSLLKVIEKFPDADNQKQGLKYILLHFDCDEQITLRRIYNFLASRGPKSYRDLYYPDFDRNIEDIDVLKVIEEKLHKLLYL